MSVLVDIGSLAWSVVVLVLLAAAVLGIVVAVALAFGVALNSVVDRWLAADHPAELYVDQDVTSWDGASARQLRLVGEEERC